MEFKRRIIFLGCFALGMLLYFFACLDPVIVVEIYDPRKNYAGLFEEHVFPLPKYLTKEEVREIKKKRKKEAEEKKAKAIKEIEEIKANAIKVDGKDWQEVYHNLIMLEKQTGLRDDWNIPHNYKRRLPDDDYPSKIFFFRSKESPVNQLSSYLKNNLDQVYLYIPSLNVYLKAKYIIYSDEDIYMWGPLYVRPPIWIVYPYREYARILFFIGLLVYILLPYKTISKDALRYSRLSVFAGDFVLFLLGAVFFVLPLLISRGTVQALTIITPITVVMWSVSLLMFYFIIKISVWYASYQLLPLDEGIKIATYKGVNLFRYDEMEYFQPVILKPPKWLEVLMWIAALSGRGGAGRAILLSSSQTGTIGIRLKNGRDLLIVVTEQMGTTALKGFEKVIEKLRASGVKELDEVREIRSLGFEVVR